MMSLLFRFSKVQGLGVRRHFSRYEHTPKTVKRFRRIAKYLSKIDTESWIVNSFIKTPTP